MRAVADNRDLAASSGIDVNRVILVVWVMGGALAALGGVLLGLSDQVQWDMGFRLLLLMFAGVTLGGLGTAYGALVGSLVVGVFVQMSTFVLPSDVKYVGGLLLLIVILVIRPQGILGSRARIGLDMSSWTRFLQRCRQLMGFQAIFFALLAIGLNVHFGYTGLLNFGQIGFARCSAPTGWPSSVASSACRSGPASLIGLLCSVLLALLLGLPTLRLRRLPGHRHHRGGRDPPPGVRSVS